MMCNLHLIFDALEQFHFDGLELIRWSWSQGLAIMHHSLGGIQEAEALSVKGRQLADIVLPKLHKLGLC